MRVLYIPVHPEVMQYIEREDKDSKIKNIYFNVFITSLNTYATMKLYFEPYNFNRYPKNIYSFDMRNDENILYYVRLTNVKSYMVDPYKSYPRGKCEYILNHVYLQYLPYNKKIDRFILDEYDKDYATNKYYQIKQPRVTEKYCVDTIRFLKEMKDDIAKITISSNIEEFAYAMYDFLRNPSKIERNYKYRLRYYNQILVFENRY